MTTEFLLCELWREASTKYLNAAYRTGLVNNIFIFFRGMLGGKTFKNPIPCEITSQDRIAFFVFKNEKDAANKNKNNLQWNKSIEFNQSSLNFLGQGIGWLKLIRMACSFILKSFKLKGSGILFLFAHPLIAYLVYEYFSEFLRNKKPEVIFVFNLIHPVSVAVAKAAKRRGIRVEYCEHAATTKLMLNNIDDYDKFWVAHHHTKELMIGNGVRQSKIQTTCSRLEAKHIKEKIKTIGVCINDLDYLNDVLDLALLLNMNGIVAIYRIHDADPRFADLRKKLTKLGHEVESAKSSLISEYLNKIDLVIAGNSNVVGDAIESGTPVLYVWLGDASLKDYYGYVNAYGLKSVYRKAELIETIHDLVH